MRGRYKRKDPKERGDTVDIGAEFSPLPGEPAAGLAGAHAPGPGSTLQDVGSKKRGRTICSTCSPCEGAANVSVKTHITGVKSYLQEYS